LQHSEEHICLCCIKRYAWKWFVQFKVWNWRKSVFYYEKQIFGWIFPLFLVVFDILIQLLSKSIKKKSH